MKEVGKKSGCRVVQGANHKEKTRGRLGNCARVKSEHSSDTHNDTTWHYALQIKGL